MEIVRAHGLEIAYERAGDGPLLVLVHGGCLDSRSWRPQMALADEFTVVAWDEPGAGRSSDVQPHFTLADYAACLAALIESLGLGPAHVAGLSWGGTLALELYRRHRDVVATLIFADTYAGWKGSLPEEEVRVRLAGGGPPENTPAEVAALLEEIEGDARPQSMKVALPLMAGADLRDVLPQIAVPTLLIWGERDRRSPLTVAREFERAIPDARLAVIPEAGHVSNLEQPERFNAIVREFLHR